jgi:hypothetical protein
MLPEWGPDREGLLLFLWWGQSTISHGARGVHSGNVELPTVLKLAPWTYLSWTGLPPEAPGL